MSTALREVHGTCSWLPDEANGNRVLEINGTAYEVEALVGGYRLYRWKGAEIKTIDIDAQTWQCDCEDATFRPERPGGCKHVRALKAALPRRPW